MSTMPPQTAAQKRAAKAAAAKAAAETTEFYDWDEMVEESRVGASPFRMRVKVKPAEGTEPEAVEYEYIEIPVPSGANYVNVTSSRARGDVASVIIGLTNVRDDPEAGQELFFRVMDLFADADFPVVDRFAAKVLEHYFNAPPKAADGSEGGAGE